SQMTLIGATDALDHRSHVSASTATASSAENCACRRMAGVGQTLPKVTEAFRKSNAPTSVDHRLCGFHSHSTSTANEYTSAASPTAATGALMAEGTNGARAITSAAI